MIKKNGKVLTALLATALLFGNSLTAFATDISVGISSDNATGSTPSEFLVDADAIGGGLVVTIPASLELSRDTDTGNYKASDVVSAKGNMDVTKKLQVSTGTEITYANSADATITASGAVTFGTNGVEQWTAEQTKNSLTTLDSRNIDVSVAASELEYIGTYSTTVYFNIELVDATVAAVEIPKSYLYYTEAIEGNTSVSGAYLQYFAGLNSFEPDDAGLTAPSDNMTILVLDEPDDLIEVYCFSGTNITSVSMSDSVIIIDPNTFENCTSLASVTLSSNIAKIGDSAFAGCTALTSIVYKDTTYTSVTELAAALAANNVTVGTDAFANIGLSD